jgi:hypothetical protein
MALLVGGVVSVQDYLRVVAIFSPSDDAAPLTARIADGQHSLFFAHHADYAAATTAAQPGQAMQAFVRAPHFLLDVRLMSAWARALNESGDAERARHVAQRLREFRNEQAVAFFAPCQTAAVPGTPAPFQCLAPARPLGYRDFR